MVATSVEQLDKLGDLLVNESVPLKVRYRALFTLKNLGGTDAVRNIGKGFQDKSALLKHECGYCLGQMQDKSAIPILIDVLVNKQEDAMVRHEAGEALGAIGDYTNEAVLNALNSCLNDELEVVHETCEIALKRLDWLKNQAKSEQNDLSLNPYCSVDPAPPTVSKKAETLEELKSTLIDESKSLFERYRALFALRNLGTDDAILAICEGLKCKSALFRHEIAYVLGQIQSVITVNALKVNLEDSNENYMVRHECAEALGSIATSDCVKILENYVNDSEIVVKESCQVALDMTDYEINNEFQYANGLTLLSN